MKKIFHLPLVIAISLAALVAQPVRAAEIEGVTFSDTIRVAKDPTYSLNIYGLGLLRYRIVFRGYVAALYLPDGSSGNQALSNLPRRLELSYFWSIAGQDFALAAEQLLAKQLTPPELTALRPRINSLHQAYVDVEPGDRYALTYIPDVGTELRLNGERLATVPGQDFAKAYFSMWLGENPLDQGLREDLLRLR